MFQSNNTIGSEVMKVAIIGGTGYGGMELIRLLDQHPLVSLEQIISTSEAGQPIGKVFPHLSSIVDCAYAKLDIASLASSVDLVFLATPTGVSKDLAPQLLAAQVRCIDLSGDFRLQDPQSYQFWYKNSSADPLWLEKAVYGLSELYASEIANAQLVANPGCYPTASLLGLLPLIENNLIDLNSIIIDAKSGVSGAGRSASPAVHFCNVNDNIKAYKVGEHQHTPEIEQVLQRQSGKKIQVTFTTQLIPVTRGILTTIYANLGASVSASELVSLYQQYYDDHHFVRIREVGQYPNIKEVFGSNFCDIGLYVDQRTNRVTVVSVIDNLIKGASGQAVQNLNIIAGWDVTTGLTMAPLYP